MEKSFEFQKLKFNSFDLELDYLNLLKIKGAKVACATIKAYKSLDYLKELGVTALYFEAELLPNICEKIVDFVDWQGQNNIDLPLEHQNPLEKYLQLIETDTLFWDEEVRLKQIEIYLKEKPIIKLFWEEAKWNEIEKTIEL